MRFDSNIKKLLLILFFVFPCDLHASEIIPIDRHLKVNIKKNVTEIEISKPHKNGLSYNKYRKFNVPETGVVLNNGIKDSESYLAGKIEGNINFQGSSASLIINEVINWYPSDLSGAMEVSGNPASVIIANPNGITCDGCNFIKVPDITLATGKINFKAVNDSLYEQTVSHSRGFYITRRDQGHYIGTQLPAGSKLPDGFKIFDYYDSKDKIAQFKNYSRDDVPLRTDNIKKRVLHIGLPEKTTPEQWKSINRAVKNANDKNIEIKITIIKGN
ncbi:filamentous hemagglutinin N-terminal domain-containing protein [Morganella morganii]